MFEILGFIATCAALLWATFAWLIMAWDTLGKYNIGGVPNSLGGKVFTLILLLALCFLWKMTFESSPFSIVTTKIQAAPQGSDK
jgi:hypothetical protein